MDSKPFYASRTFWVNIIAVVASIAAASGVNLGAELQASIVTAVLAIVNIALRFLTKQPITIKKTT